MKLVTVAQMQAAEAACGVPVPELMENAGLAVAQEAWLLLGEVAERRIVVLVGPGNNGCDGLVAARHLKEWGAVVTAYLLKRRDRKDAVYAAALEMKVAMEGAETDAKRGYKRLEELLSGAELVIDALLGTGSARPIEGPLLEVLTRLRAAREKPLPPRLLAVDLPTGVNPDTGAVDERCVAADATVALGYGKVGLHVQPGARMAGRVEAVDIGMPKTVEGEDWTELMTARRAREALPPRPVESHKGTFGKAMVVAGSPRYIGAAYLACLGALRSGAGLVTHACAGSLHPIFAGKLSEATFEPLPDEEGYLSAAAAHGVGQAVKGYDALLVGPGLGQEGYVRAFMRSLLGLLREGSLRALVIDADGLNNLSKIERWWEELAIPAVVTPHPGELSRLTGLSLEEIASDRLGAARRCAEEWGATVALKGANTVVASAQGDIVRSMLSPFANPGLASGGTGDVLAGAIAGYVAQGLSPYEAACVGVYVHGLAGELVRAELGSAGMIASDVAAALPRAMRELRGS